MKFAWQIADGMNYLSLRNASLSVRDNKQHRLQKQTVFNDLDATTFQI